MYLLTPLVLAGGASVASANNAAPTSNASAAGVVNGSADSAASTTNANNASVATGVAAVSVPAPPMPMGAIVGAPTAGSLQTLVHGQTCCLNGNTWYQATYGANGIDYRMAPTP